MSDLLMVAQGHLSCRYSIRHILLPISGHMDILPAVLLYTGYDLTDYTNAQRLTAYNFAV